MRIMRFLTIILLSSLGAAPLTAAKAQQLQNPFGGPPPVSTNPPERKPVRERGDEADAATASRCRTSKGVCELMKPLSPADQCSCRIDGQTIRGTAFRIVN